MRGSQLVTPELLGNMQHRYEETDETVRSIATDCGIAERTLYKWIALHGWRRRRDRPPRDLPPELRLTLAVDRALGETAAEAAAVSRAQRGTIAREDARERADGGCAADPGPSQIPSLERSRISAAALHAAARPGHETADDGPDDAPAAPFDVLSVAERLERQLEQNLARVERMRETQWPQSTADAERTTRALERLTDTLLKVRRLRNPDTNTAGRDDFDMPRDIDEFRRALARRIDAFVRSRTGAGVPGPGEPRGAG